jgi:putative membrane protein
MKNMNLRQILFVLLLLAVAVSFVGAADRFTWWMEAFPVFIGLPILVVSREKFRLTNLIYVLLFLHALVLLIGAHYTYAKVPAFDWLRDEFHLSRNHFDRLGHFMQGFVPALLARELLLRTSPLRWGKWMFAIIALSCLGISALYELLEWATSAATGTAAEAFLGTQGDIWDTQKDMLMALIGALCALAFFSPLHDRCLKKQGFFSGPHG